MVCGDYFYLISNAVAAAAIVPQRGTRRKPSLV